MKEIMQTWLRDGEITEVSPEASRKECSLANTDTRHGYLNKSVLFSATKFVIAATENE